MHTGSCLPVGLRTPNVSLRCSCSSRGRATTAGVLPAGSSTADAASKLGHFLSRRRWLRPTPDTPIHLVRAPTSQPHIPPPSTTVKQGSKRHKKTAEVSNNTSIAGSDLCSLTGDEHGHMPLGQAGEAADSLNNCCQTAGPCYFYLLRDDLLHPVLGGNKVRKLDALLPQLRASGATDVVTCGGLQSAHLAAVAVGAAELGGLRSHLLVRGEAPQVPTGYHLVSRMYGSQLSYVSRGEYADRGAMLASRAEAIRQSNPTAKVAVVAEGGGEAAALLGLVRLVHWLALGGGVGSARHCGCGTANEDKAQATSTTNASTTSSSPTAAPSLVTAVQCPLGLPHAATTPYKLVVDSGTGTTAIGLALGIALLGLPWSVLAVTLAGDLPYYLSQQEQLVRNFLELYGKELYGREAAIHDNSGSSGGRANEDFIAAATTTEAAAVTTASIGGSSTSVGSNLPLVWVPRCVPRKFGRVLAGEIAACKQIAREYGIGLDPIYSLAAWEVACREAAGTAAAAGPAADVGATAAGSDPRVGAALTMLPELQQPCPHVVMLHGGGALGLHGLAQRYPEEF